MVGNPKSSVQGLRADAILIYCLMHFREVNRRRRDFQEKYWKSGYPLHQKRRPLARGRIFWPRDTVSRITALTLETPTRTPRVPSNFLHLSQYRYASQLAKLSGWNRPFSRPCTLHWQPRIDPRVASTAQLYSSRAAMQR